MTSASLRAAPLVASFALAGAAALATQAQAATACDDLAKVKVAGATITAV
ncbi:hypothetical protein PMI01_00827, partial [Caulobacter sp. AP07]